MKAWKRFPPGKRPYAALLLLLLALMYAPVQAQTTVWAWGYNGYGQVGDGTTTDRSTPLQVSGLSDVVAIAGGDAHSLALTSDGHVWGWGLNNYGQVGDGTRTNRSAPVPVSGLDNVIAIAAGWGHSMALRSDGTVWTWGDNGLGELGDGTRNPHATPIQVPGLSEVIAISSANVHNLVIRSDGTVWAWGWNGNGQLGDGTRTTRAYPAQINGLSSVVAVAGGAWHSLALTADGRMWAWGDNRYGELGDGTTTERHIPVLLNGLSGVIMVAAQAWHSLALTYDGTVWTWGYNGFGQLGDGTMIDRSTPAPVSGLNDIVALAGRPDYANGHNLVIRSDGTVWVWGWNRYGQLGDGTMTDRATPIPVNGLNGVIAVEGGGGHSLALAAPRSYSATSLSAEDSTGRIGQTVPLRALLTRASDGSPLPGKLVAFSSDDTFAGLALTDPNGIATFGCCIPEATGPGLRTLTARFFGDGQGEPAIGTGILTVTRGQTAVNTTPTAGAIGQTVELRADLASAGAPLPDRLLTFADGASTLGTATTDSQGIARLHYTIPVGAAQGDHALTVSFAGDASYLPSSGNLTVAVRPVSFLYTNPATGYPGQSIDLVASLWSEGTWPSGKAITFREGATSLGTATTDSRGVARLSYTVPAGTAPGSHTISASFDGDADHNASRGDLVLTVTQTPTIAYTKAAHGYPGRTLVLTASLWAHGTRLRGKTITFAEGATSLGTATTDARGIARMTYTLPADSALGDHTLTAAFAGDTDHLPCRRELPLSIVAAGTPMPTATYTNPAAGRAGQTITLVASLWSDGVPLGGKTITFADGATTLGSATTDDRGIARFTYTIPSGTPAGSHPLAAAFAGDADFLPSTGDLALTVVGG